MREADKLARQVVMDRDVNCRATGEHLGSLQWAHVHSRSYKAIRHDARNAVVLCAGHHTYFTHHPLEWEQWCRDNEIDWDGLRIEAIERGPYFSLPDVLEQLRGGAPSPNTTEDREEG
jgi:hypothetical protein